MIEANIMSRMIFSPVGSFGSRAVRLSIPPIRLPSISLSSLARMLRNRFTHKSKKKSVNIFTVTSTSMYTVTRSPLPLSHITLMIIVKKGQEEKYAFGNNNRHVHRRLFWSCRDVYVVYVKGIRKAVILSFAQDNSFSLCLIQLNSI